MGIPYTVGDRLLLALVGEEYTGLFVFIISKIADGVRRGVQTTPLRLTEGEAYRVLCLQVRTPG
jgi:hypothetical protein